MQALRLGAHKLPEAEVVLLRTLFRLFAYDKAFCWTLSSEAPYDALVVDANAPEAQSPEFRASVSAVRVARRLSPLPKPMMVNGLPPASLLMLPSTKLRSRPSTPGLAAVVGPVRAA